MLPAHEPYKNRREDEARVNGEVGGGGREEQQEQKEHLG